MHLHSNIALQKMKKKQVTKNAKKTVYDVIWGFFSEFLKANMHTSIVIPILSSPMMCLWITVNVVWGVLFVISIVHWLADRWPAHFLFLIWFWACKILAVIFILFLVDEKPISISPAHYYAWNAVFDKRFSYSIHICHARGKKKENKVTKTSKTFSGCSESLLEFFCIREIQSRKKYITYIFSQSFIIHYSLIYFIKCYLLYSLFFLFYICLNHLIFHSLLLINLHRLLFISYYYSSILFIIHYIHIIYIFIKINLFCVFEQLYI